MDFRVFGHLGIACSWVCSHKRGWGRDGRGTVGEICLGEEGCGGEGTDYGKQVKGYLLSRYHFSRAYIVSSNNTLKKEVTEQFLAHWIVLLVPLCGVSPNFFQSHLGFSLVLIEKHNWIFDDDQKVRMYSYLLLLDYAYTIVLFTDVVNRTPSFCPDIPYYRADGYC